jgi:hypothetical protein
MNGDFCGMMGGCRHHNHRHLGLRGHRRSRQRQRRQAEAGQHFHLVARPAPAPAAGHVRRHPAVVLEDDVDLRPATVSPCCCRYSLTAASTCRPVEANGPDIGIISPTLSGVAEAAAAMPAQQAGAGGGRSTQHQLAALLVDGHFVSLL